MPRSSYYQQVGNPTQAERLPASRPCLSLPVAPLPFYQAAIALAGTFVLLEGVLLLAWLFGTWRASSQAAGIVLCLALCVIGFVLAIFIYVWRQMWTVALAVSYVGICLSICLPTSLLSQVTVGALATALFGWHFAAHWFAVCSTSPLSKHMAHELRAAWRLPLAFLILGPALVIILGTWSGQGTFAVLVVAAWCCVHLASPGRNHAANKMQVLWDSLVSWCTYNRSDANAVGLCSHPAGECTTRLMAMCLTVAVVGTAWARTIQQREVPNVSVPLTDVSLSTHSSTSPSVAYATVEAVHYESSEGTELWALSWFIGLNILQLFIAIGLPMLFVLPALVDASRFRQTEVGPENWHALIHEIQHSPDPIERHSYYQGRVVHDSSPLLVPRLVFCENAHFPGDAGAGKTSLGLLPWIEQTVLFGDCSLVVIDLKADSSELLATLFSAAQRYRERTGWQIPIKHFTNQPTLSTYAFNPLTQPYWDDFDPYMKTDILCAGWGLNYGTDYARGFYSEANAALLHFAIKKFPDVRTFAELAERVRHIVLTAKKRDLHPELRNAGVHIQAVLDRLAACDALNVGPATAHPREVIEQAIDLRELFRQPQIIHCHLSSALSPGTSPMIARLLLYSLLSAATQTERKHQVFVVIDEFQRMAAHNVEYMLQLARSMGVGIILANQSLQDLGDLIPAIEANCRYRQWFSVSSLDDRRRLIESGGETVETFASHTEHLGAFTDYAPYSRTFSEHIVPRVSANEVALASDHPLQSIVRISRGSGYAQYGGLPFVVESTYHISRSEYERRKSMPWPRSGAGSFIPRDLRDQTSPARPPAGNGPIITTENIDSRIPENDPPGPTRRRRLDGDHE
jgi:hypothetical protein